MHRMAQVKKKSVKSIYRNRNFTYKPDRVAEYIQRSMGWGVGFFSKHRSLFHVLKLVLPKFQNGQQKLANFASDL